MKKLISKTIIAIAIVGAALSPVAIPQASAKAEVRIGADIGIRLPKGAISIRVGDARYHFHDGRYYRKVGNRYIVAKAPRGAIIRTLPRGYTKVVVKGRTYYRYGDVYYQSGRKGYVVVHLNSSPKTVVAKASVAETAAIEEVSSNNEYTLVWRGDDELQFKNGQFFRKTSKGLVWVETPYDAIAPELPVDTVSV
ncbi:MAG: DUF6515 family protein [Verrucomicrobiota bacterium]